MKTILFLIFIMLTANICFAQERKDEPNIVPVESSACENNPVAISIVASEAVQEKERVFVIFRAGRTETETANRKRLAYVKKNSLERRAAFNKLEFIYALGEKSKDEGKIEFYVGGRLSSIIIAPKNRTPCLDCCGDERYYPQDLVKKKRIIKRKHK